ncbi:hypothetical protein [Eikenella corrodens]|nr:hypothetical protein [Eikenella corrodens]UAK75081.1 hypothetical protein K8P00_00425 [Eikenella corrodens]
MKFRSLYKWENVDGQENLIFSAQLMEEMLFHYTIDTYKPSVMGISLLVHEALTTIEEVEKGNIKEPNIKHVLEELCDFFDKDTIAKKLVPIDKDEIFTILQNPKSNKNKIKNILGILNNCLNDIKYKNILEKEIISLSLDPENKFSELRRLIRSYITSLISNGYHPYFIRKQMLSFFWEGDGKIINGNNLLDFFNVFSFKQKNYHVYSVVDKVFLLYQEPNDTAIPWMKFHKKSQLPTIIDNNNFLKIGDNEIFCLMEKIKDIDPYSAREYSENILKLNADLINIFHHKKKPTWKNKFMVIDCEENKAIPIDKPLQSMLKCIDLKEQKAKIKIQNFIKSFSLEDGSFSKFINSIRLHSMALHSDSVENQILNLWVALESLVPSETKNSDESNIEHIINSIIPFLNITYLSNLIDNLVKDLIRWDMGTIRHVSKYIDGDGFKNKLINILVKEEYLNNFNDLLDKTRDFYLLKDRLIYFKDILSSKKKINSVISAHTRRLEWQIRRIYRTRNLIVHTGNTPNYTHSLIEHTHNYLDIVLNTLISLATPPNQINSVGEGFDYISLQYKSFLKSCCEDKDIKLNDDNLKMLVDIINFR